MEPEHWNASIDIMTEPIESLSPVRRVAALVFQYHGRVMNGGDTLHFDARANKSDAELIAALKTIGAANNAAIVAEANFLRRQADDEEEDESEREFAIEMIEADIDPRFGKIERKLMISLENYLESHPVEFPNPRSPKS
jgi:hypothetical protein